MLVKRKSKEPAVPAERHETIRREIVSFLQGRHLTAKELSALARVSEKEVYEHLQHIQRTLAKKNEHFVIIPSECKKCGFIFRKRDRFKKPGRCPVCRSELIEEPLFSVTMSKEPVQP